MWSRILRLARTTSLVAFAVASTAPAYAGVESDMRGFFDSIGTLGNVTGPGAHQGQEAGFYTGGNLYMRVPSRNAQLAALSMPGFRAGCGGIDAFAGAFSFINADQLVAMMKSIASSAIGFSFKLALETISPVIAETIGELNDLAQRINQTNISSCETAQALVGGLWPRSDRASKTICEQLGNSSGIFSDYAASRHGCGSEGQRTTTLNNATGPIQDTINLNKNMTWEAMKKNNFFSAMSNEEKQLWMTLAGTIIMRGGANDDAPATFQVVPARVLDDNLIQALMGTTGTGAVTVAVNACDEFDRCLTVTPGGANFTISAANSFLGRVKNLLDDMVDKILANQRLTTEEVGLLNMTSMPFYKMLNVYTAYSREQARAEIPRMAEMVALDVLGVWIGEGLREVEKASGVMQSADREYLEQWRNQIREGRQSVIAKRDEAERRAVQQQALIEKTRTIENILASRFSSQVGGALQFAKTIRRVN